MRTRRWVGSLPARLPPDPRTALTFDPDHAEVFRYVGVDVDPVRHEVVCRYALDG